jgi:hypothetical protein
MHRTLGEATMQPLAHSLRQQQRRFDEFRREYNEQRPHQALGQCVPATLYDASGQPYPRRTPEPEYGVGWQVRKVANGGQSKWAGQPIFISHALSGKQIGFEPIAEGIWRVWFYRNWLGVWDERRRTLRRPRQCTEEKPTQGSPAGSPR